MPDTLIKALKRPPAFPAAGGALAAAVSFCAIGVWRLPVALGILALSLFITRSRGVQGLGVLTFFFFITSLNAIFSEAEAIPTWVLNGQEHAFHATVLQEHGHSRAYADLKLTFDADTTRTYKARAYAYNRACYFRAGQIIHGKAKPVLPNDYSRVDGIELFLPLPSYKFRIDSEPIQASPVELILDRIAQSSLSSSTAGLLSSSLLATDDVAPADTKAFRFAGISHLLCLSGFHVGVIAMLIGILFWPVRLSHRYWRLHSVLIIGGIWAYAWMVGFSPTVLRASIMATTLLLAFTLGREVVTGNALLLAMAIILAIEPQWINSVGFQLSCAAVAGIIVFAKKLTVFGPEHPLPHAFASSIAVTLAATLSTLPIMISCFNTFAPAIIFTNILAVWVFSLFLITGVIWLILLLLGMEISSLSYILELMHATMRRICSYADVLQGERLSVEMSQQNLWSLTACIILFGIALHSPNKSAWKWICGSSFFFITTFLIA